MIDSVLRRRSFLASSLALTASASLPGTARGAPLAAFRLYDTHAHFRSNDPQRYPFRSDMSAALRADVMARPVTPEAVIGMWDDAGVEMGCGVQFNDIYYTDNRYLLDVAEQYPSRISPVVVLDPTDPATPAALMSLARAFGISGVRFASRPDAGGDYPFLTDAARGAWEAANELELAVVLLPVRSVQTQALPAAMRRVGALAEQYPNVNIVLDHVGFPVEETTPTFGFSPEHLALAAHDNVYYKYTTLTIVHLVRAGVSARDFLNYAVGIYGAEHFVWGSAVGNYLVRFLARSEEGAAAVPNLEQYRDRVELALDSAEGLTLAQKRALFHDTAKALFIRGGRASRRRR
jgi:predicted TIM-barrel fold metal-dependent hydrolase